jgi:hypothetical protein
MKRQLSYVDQKETRRKNADLIVDYYASDGRALLMARVHTPEVPSF